MQVSIPKCPVGTMGKQAGDAAASQGCGHTARPPTSEARLRQSANLCMFSPTSLIPLKIKTHHHPLSSEPHQASLNSVFSTSTLWRDPTMKEVEANENPFF